VRRYCHGGMSRHCAAAKVRANRDVQLPAAPSGFVMLVCAPSALCVSSVPPPPATGGSGRGDEEPLEISG